VNPNDIHAELESAEIVDGRAMLTFSIMSLEFEIDVTDFVIYCADNRKEIKEVEDDG